MIGSSPARRHIIQGQFAVEERPDVCLSTILGSCVTACLRDPLLGIGGMNHFLLPDGGGVAGGVQYGANAMELLINALLKRGGRRERLEAKLFGGARMTDGLSDIGRQNAEFARGYLADEGIVFLGGSLGGDFARRVLYWPASGLARQQKLAVPPVAMGERARSRPAPGGEVELFG